jgi:hypothetical protein
MYLLVPGLVILQGEAIVTLPEYFEALNQGLEWAQRRRRADSF